MKNYLIGFTICIVLAGIVSAFTFRNRIYAWTLGDVSVLYDEAMALYKARQYEEALPLLEKLVGIDSAARCKFVLGDMYYRDLQKCAEWLTKAAMQGEATAQFNLGNMYFLGKGVERDLDKAALWYGLAKNQGHRNAERFLKQLEEHKEIAELDSNFTIRLIPEK